MFEPSSARAPMIAQEIIIIMIPVVKVPQSAPNTLVHSVSSKNRHCTVCELSQWSWWTWSITPRNITHLLLLFIFSAIKMWRRSVREKEWKDRMHLPSFETLFAFSCSEYCNICCVCMSFANSSFHPFESVYWWRARSVWTSKRKNKRKWKYTFRVVHNDDWRQIVIETMAEHTLWRSRELMNDNFGPVTALAPSTTQGMDRFRL